MPNRPATGSATACVPHDGRLLRASRTTVGHCVTVGTQTRGWVTEVPLPALFPNVLEVLRRPGAADQAVLTRQRGECGDPKGPTSYRSTHAVWANAGGFCASTTCHTDGA